MRKFTACAVLAVAAVGIASAPAYAAPPAPATPAAPAPFFKNIPASQTVVVNGVHYELDRAAGSAVLKAADGTFARQGDSLTIADAKGQVVDSVPLVYRKDNTQFPINADISAHAVRLTPQTTGGTPVAQPISADTLAHLRPVSQVEPKDLDAKAVDESFSPRDQQELSAFGSRATISSLVGAVVGALIGVTVGCIAGAVAVGTISAAVSALLAGLPGAIIGCIAGVATVGSAGALLGTILVGGPMMLWSAYQYFSTINSPCTTPGGFCTNPQFPPAPAPKR
ncbi:hypothetical protein KO481_29640 [Nocardia sp. NEAU-G5]|uniref:DUF8020 domain-containing protein n=1 Tax=Nocardia albiluteola TaxID=2842303 RepID=A0ABS6B6B1_9NOCA|nr:hypothetical protein [Nocardia albiluteola]MBU3062488.1 hypothetical protein [Nocardia albiluteola]MBU3065678.1 hypothetical protein [Nocardia albiluteola]